MENFLTNLKKMQYVGGSELPVGGEVKRQEQSIVKIIRDKLWFKIEGEINGQEENQKG